MSTTERVHVDIDVIATITLDNPPLNLVDAAMTAQLDDALDQVSAGSVRTVVVAGAGERAFCAGSDIKEFDRLAGRVAQQKLLFEKYVYRKLARLPMPSIAAIESDALGGGLELALCCDLRVAARHARLGLPESRLGVIPGSGGTQRLPALVGSARAKQMMFLAESLTATEAERIGLVNRVVDDGAALTDALDMAGRIADRAPGALRKIKSLVDGASERSLDTGLAEELDASERVFMSQDMTEGTRAFFARQSPRFTGS